MEEPPGRLLGPAVRGVVLLCHARVLVAAVGLLFFAHAQIDDLWRAGWGRQLGLWRAMKFEYGGWCGRWLGTGLSYLLGALVDVRQVYTEALLTITLVYLLSIGYLIRGVLPGLSRARALLLSIVLLELYWTGQVTPGQTFYWMTGGIENHLGVAIPMLLIGLLVRTPDEQAVARRLVRLAGVFALAVAATGFNELYGAMLCGVLFVGTVIACLERRPSRLEWGVASLAGVIGWLIVYSAPGNVNRMATVAHIARNTARTRDLFLEQVSLYARQWLLDVKLLAASLAFVLLPAVRGLRPSWCLWRGGLLRWLAPAVATGLLLVAVAAHAWSSGEYLAPRTLAVLYMSFLLGWFVTLVAWTRWPEETLPQSAGLRRIADASGLVLAVSLALATVTNVAFADLRTRARRYDRAMEQRYRLLDAAVARGEKRVVVPALPETPLSYFDMGIVDDPTHFRTTHSLKFYGLESVSVR